MTTSRRVMRVMRLWLDGSSRAQAGSADEARVSAAVEVHFDFVWRLLRRLGLRPADADDAAQQVFMIATQKLSTVAPGSERSFLYGTTLRVAANARRAHGRRREQADTAMEERGASTPPPDAQSILNEAWALLDELLDKLPDDLRRVLVLAEIEQLEVAEIAALEGIPVGTAASRLRRARADFQAELKRSPARNPFGPGGHS